MFNAVVLFSVITLVYGQGTNNGQNNVNCETCGQGNGQGNINDPAVQETMAALSESLPFLNNMGLPGMPASQSLECPIPQTWFETTRTEPTCTTDSDCTGRREICCNWFSSMHCLTGIATAPKDGTCPAEIPQGFPCRADYGGCRFDSECSGTQKCCNNSKCFYAECTEPVPASPVICTQIACPPPPSANCVNIGTTFPNGPDCEPCTVCNDPPAPPATQPTTRPTTQAPQPPVICTLIACPPPPSANCVNIGTTFPNGPDCEPCTVCNDPPAPPAARPTTQAPPQACTRRGCGLTPPGPDCVDVRNSYPNGPNCEPPCPYCADAPTPAPPQACGRRGCGLTPPGTGCVDVRNSYPNGPNCEPPCPYCADPTPTQTQYTSSAVIRSCMAANMYFRTTLNDCRMFDISMTPPSSNAVALASPQMCGAGTIFDLRICGCNHIRAVVVATCSS